MSDDTPKKLYKLLVADDKICWRNAKGAFGNGQNLPSLGLQKGKIRIALGHLKETRVFFKDEATAIAAGYRPCGVCLRDKYTEWQQHQSTSATKMSDNTPKKLYKLLGADGEFYYSEEPGTLGDNFIKKNDKIYGRLDCPAALRSLKNPNSTYPKYRVFFKDEATAIAAGYRPCGTCMREKYLEWKRQQEQQRQQEQPK